MNTRVNVSDGVTYLTFEALEVYPWVKHTFSTRLGGVSSGEFSAMNLSLNRGDIESNVYENYHLFCRASGFEYESLVASTQEHGTEILRVYNKDRGHGIHRRPIHNGIDALITNEKGVTLVTYYADCVPLYFIDPKTRAIGLAHSGWRGTYEEIGAKTIKKMNDEFGSRWQDMICVIGPSIGGCCFEVSEDVADNFSSMIGMDGFIQSSGPGKYKIDLWSVNKQILLNSGVAQENIYISGLCTCCNSELFFSHRRTGGKRGTLAAMMSLV